MDPISLIIGLVLSVAGMILKQIARQDAQAKPSGFRGTAQVGGDHPLAFIMGWYATAGKMEYAGTWGSDGDTPNAYLTKVFTLSDLPVRGLSGVLVNGARCTLAVAPHPTRGYPVLEFRDKKGVDHLWVRFHDGTQSTADTLLRTALGAHPDRPWLADMIGTGVAYGIWTARFNREVFNREPELVWEINGIPLADPREGSAEHENPAVGIDNVLRGFSFGGSWFWGPQGIGDHHLPASTWRPQMDKCDVLVERAGGGMEKRFRFGLEVTVDKEPHEVIGELLKACSGRVAEIGGTYKLLVGEPDAPVVSFTDEDVFISEGQSYEPFPGLENTFNAITATYPEPAEGWENKEAPPRYSSDWEAEDEGRRLPFSTTFSAVPFAGQVQRLMRPAIEEARRFRRHSHTMPPAWWEYEVLDVALWSTSERNGYVNKSFLITVMDDQRNGNQLVGLQEIDPADYPWHKSYELPYSVSPIVIARPTPQPMTGWTVQPAYVPDNDGIPRRPSIEVGYAPGLVDVRAVRVQARLAGATAPVFDAEHPYDPDELEPAVLLNNAWLGKTDYEVRGKYVPFSGRSTLWSNQDEDGTEGAWLAVQTPEVPADIPPIAPENLGPELAAGFGLMAGSGPGSLAALIAGWEDQLDKVAGAVATANMTANVIRESLIAQFGEATAAIFEEKMVRASETAALASQVTQVVASLPNILAGGYLRMEGIAAEDGASSTIMFKAFAELEGTLSQAAALLRAAVNGEGGTDAYFGVLGNFHVFETVDGPPILAFSVSGGKVRFNDWDSIATVGGVPVIQMHGSTGYFGITIA